MGYFSFPHTRTYDSDLGWLIKHLKGIDEKLDEYLENSVITFADPIQWDITEQYTTLTMVIDSDGTAYLSKQPVPAGVDISNTDYWMPIFNYDDNINGLRAQIAYNAETSPTTAIDLTAGDLVFWNGILYKVITDMIAGTAFIIGANISQYTVDERIRDFADSINNVIAYIDTNDENIRSTIAANTETSPTITDPLAKDDLVYWNGVLYKALVDLPAGAALIIGSNIDEYTVDRKINDTKTDAESYADTAAGNVQTNLDNAVRAINQDIADLNTEIQNIPTVFAVPELYGAAGDGITDDTQAVIQAINAVLSGDRLAVLLENKYLITETISINRDIIIQGSGTLVYTAPMDVLYISDCKATIDGITFSGPAPQDTNNGYHIVTLHDTYDSAIINCKFDKVYGEAAIYVNSATNTIVSNNKIIDFSFIGILIYRDCTNTIVSNNIIVNCVNTSSGYGIQNNVPNSGGVYATDLIIKNNIIKHIPVWDGIMSHGGTNVTITGNLCDDCRTGIDCSAKYTDSDSIQKNYVITDNTLISSTDLSVPGSNINVGIIFGYDNNSTSICATIANNNIRNFNIGTGGNTGGIRLSNCSDVTVTGNNILNCYRGMIWAAGYAVCERWVISNNTIEVTAQGMNIGGGAYQQIRVVGNNFRGIGANLWAFAVGGAARLIDVAEMNNSFDNIYEAPPSSGARQTFYTEYDVNINANQANTVYKAGDRVYNNSPAASYIGWVARNTGIHATTAWAANTDITTGALVYNASNAYVCVKSGTTGAAAPTHTTGDSANGTAVLRYVGDTSVTWKTFGAISA